MTFAEKEFISKKIVELISARRAPGAASGTRCLCCDGVISEREFLLMSAGAGKYSIGCLRCGSARELFPSVNPFMFADLARRISN